MNDLIEKLSNLRSQFNCFDENERDAYHTLSESIKVLSERPEPCEDAVSREAISKWLKQYGQDVIHGKYKFSLMYIWKNLMDLPSVTPKRKTGMSDLTKKQVICEYCHEDSDGYVKPVEKNCHAFIRFGMDGWELSLKANGWHGSAKIRYCPMCGRKLKNDKR
jgi:hypothetical protein